MIGGSGGAAEKLGLKRTTLNSKLRKLGIERERLHLALASASSLSDGENRASAGADHLEGHTGFEIVVPMGSSPSPQHNEIGLHTLREQQNAISGKSLL